MGITFEEVKALATNERLTVIEDFVILLTNNKKSIPIDSVGCLPHPPYTILYDTGVVMFAINELKSSC